VSKPLVSIVIITWDRKEDVLETVQDIYAQPYHDFEIIVVDNASTDGTIDALRHTYPEVRIVALATNRGVAARNDGITLARGEIILCLDSDASPGQNTLANLARKFQAAPEVGVINSKIVNAYTGTIDGGPGWAYSAKALAHQDEEFLSWSFSEGGVAIRKEVFDRIGLFSEQLFFGCEGQEFSLRAWDAGFQVLYYPESLVYHRETPHMRVAGPERDCLIIKNTLIIYLTYYPWWMLVVFLPLKAGASLVRGARRGYLRQVASTLWEVVRELPALWRERRPVKSETARLYLRLQCEHGPLSWDLRSWLREKA
jgi:GT2 family glycosyltransferase